MNRYYPAGVIFHNTILGLPSWRRERLQGYLTILIMTNDVSWSGSWTWGAWRCSSGSLNVI